MGKRILYWFIGGLAALVLLAAVSVGSDSTKVDQEKSVKHEFIGAKKCKICHKEEYESWEKTSHAGAWNVLKPEEQKNEKCVGCHSTGVIATGELLVGVECEACHGAGSDYKKKSIMEDVELSIKNGLIIPDSTLCVGCHNEKSPTFKGFEYAKYRANEKGIHKMPEAKEEAGEGAEEKSED